MVPIVLNEQDQLFFAVMDSYFLQFDNSLSSNDKYCRYVRNLLIVHPNYHWTGRRFKRLQSGDGIKASSSSTSYITPHDQEVYDAVLSIIEGVLPQYIPLPTKVLRQLSSKWANLGRRNVLYIGDIHLKQLCTDGYFHRLRIRKGTGIALKSLSQADKGMILHRLYIFQAVLAELNSFSERAMKRNGDPLAITTLQFGKIIRRYIDGKYVHTKNFSHFRSLYLKG